MLHFQDKIFRGLPIKHMWFLLVPPGLLLLLLLFALKSRVLCCFESCPIGRWKKDNRFPVMFLFLTTVGHNNDNPNVRVSGALHCTQLHKEQVCLCPTWVTSRISPGCIQGPVHLASLRSSGRNEHIGASARLAVYHNRTSRRINFCLDEFMSST